MIVHTEPIYGFYNGQDPRTFRPDGESCTQKEIQAHKDACVAAEGGTWAPDNSGCQVSQNVIKCSSSFGIGVYLVVMTEDGDFLRDASYDDFQREGEWEEADNG